MRPMLAGPYERERLRFPLILQPKLDGIRAVVVDGVLYSRNQRRIQNNYIQFRIGSLPSSLIEGLDGELMVGDPTAEDAYRLTDSGVMSRHGEPKFTYMVFDIMDEKLPYIERRRKLLARLEAVPSEYIEIVPQFEVSTEEALLENEAIIVGMGYEGVILRHPDSTYKHGRSTARELKLIKLKRFEDAEATVIGFEPLYSNQNEKTIGAHGLTERSSHSANMVEQDTLGALLVTDCVTGVEFRIGSFKGLNLEQRREIWISQSAYLGKTLTYKFQKVGGYDKPRFPIFKGWRSDL